jgi:hypothetical protein
MTVEKNQDVLKVWPETATRFRALADKCNFPIVRVAEAGVELLSRMPEGSRSKLLAKIRRRPGKRTHAPA